MADLSRSSNGKLERTVSNLWNLIDRYVPTVTQETVREMACRYEDQIFDLLATVHEYRERNHALLKRMDELEREYYEKVRIPVSIGTVEAGASLMPMDFTRRYQVRWRPDEYRACVVLSEHVFLHKEETPHLFEMVGKQFEEHLKRELIPKLRDEYLKLYKHFQP